jgi:hypothetical protein
MQYRSHRLWSVLIAITLAHSGCNNGSPAEKDKARSAPAAPAPTTPQTPSAPAPTPPIPAEPPPRLAAKIDEVPGIEAKIVDDKAYIAVWTPGHEAARLALLTAVSDGLAYGSLHTAVETVLKEAGLTEALKLVGEVLARSGKLPADFATRVDAYLAANKTAPRLGLWNPFEKGKPVVDATALAMWMHPNDAPYVRERMLALARGPFRYTGKEPERRRWLMDLAEVAERVTALGAFTEGDCTMLGHEWHATTTGGVTRASCDPPAKKPQQPKLGDEFTLGDFTYWVKSIEVVNAVGSEIVHKEASEGAKFVLVHFAIRNNTNSTETVLTDDFKIEDAKGREFRSSTEANTTLGLSQPGKDLLLTELQPGLKKTTVTAFEMPDDALKGGLTLVVPEKGILGTGSIRVALQ